MDRGYIPADHGRFTAWICLEFDVGIQIKFLLENHIQKVDLHLFSPADSESTLIKDVYNGTEYIRANRRTNRGEYDSAPGSAR